MFRLCGPYTRENPAFFDFPPILKKIMNGHVAYIDGGLEIDGREILPLNEATVREECRIVKEKGISEIAVIGVFSPIDYEGLNEERAKEIILEELPGVDVVLSRDSECHYAAAHAKLNILTLLSWSNRFLRTRECNNPKHFYSQICSKNHPWFYRGNEISRTLMSSFSHAERWHNHKC